MTKIQGSSVYEASIPMLPGKHVFKFVKDGVTWECSPDIQQEVRLKMMFEPHTQPASFTISATCSGCSRSSLIIVVAAIFIACLHIVSVSLQKNNSIASPSSLTSHIRATSSFGGLGRSRHCRFLPMSYATPCAPDTLPHVRQTDLSGNVNNVITVAEPVPPLPAQPPPVPVSAPAPSHLAKPSPPSPEVSKQPNGAPATAGSNQAAKPATSFSATSQPPTKFAQTAPPLKVGTYALARPSSTSRSNSRSASAGPSRSRTPASRSPAPEMRPRSPALEPVAAPEPGKAAGVLELAAAKVDATPPIGLVQAFFSMLRMS